MPGMAKSKRKRKTGPQPFLQARDAFALVEAEADSPTKRGLVLVCGAVLDRALEELLRVRFLSLTSSRSTADKDSDFFLSNDPSPPLRSAKLRAKLAKLIGAIDQATYESLEKFFSIRNDFAHEQAPESLDSLALGDIYNSLPQWVRTHYSANREGAHCGVIRRLNY